MGVVAVARNDEARNVTKYEYKSVFDKIMIKYNARNILVSLIDER